MKVPLQRCILYNNYIQGYCGERKFLILLGMKTKREESIQDILTSFEAMADIILGQLKLLERFMKGGNDRENEH
jgi:hypothetical protein